MSESKNILLDQVAAIKNRLLKGNNSAKILFLLLSIFLWFLIKLSNEGYVTEFEIPVSYIDLPEGKKLTEEPLEVLTVKVRSHGYDLLKYQLRVLEPVSVNLSKNLSAEGGKYFWDTDKSRSKIEEIFDDNTTVVSISPEIVYLKLQEVERKKVKVYLDYQRNFSQEKAFYSAPQFDPDSVVIVGAGQDLQKVDSIFTETTELHPDLDDENLKLKLVAPKNLELQETEVAVKIKYTTLTEGTVEIPIYTRFVSDDYTLNIFPDRVKVKYQVSIEDYSLVNEADFEAYVDCSNVSDSSMSSLLKVQVESSSTHVRKLIFEPRQVEYIQIKK